MIFNSADPNHDKTMKRLTSDWYVVAHSINSSTSSPFSISDAQDRKQEPANFRSGPSRLRKNGALL